MLALEARQLVWRQDAASRAGAPDSAPDAVGDLMSSSHAMLEAISTLRAPSRSMFSLSAGSYLLARILTTTTTSRK
jgi:hypothetical protein